MNHISITKYLTISKEDYPQYVFKANNKDMLAIAESLHKTIEKYPVYAEATGLIKSSSEFLLDNLLLTFGPDLENYDFPIVIGAFACEIDSNLKFDVSEITPRSSAEQIFCIEKLLKLQPEKEFEAFVTILTEELYPEQLVSIFDKLLPIISDITGRQTREIFQIKQLNNLVHSHDFPEFVNKINSSFDVNFKTKDFNRISDLFSLINSIHCKKIMK